MLLILKLLLAKLFLTIKTFLPTLSLAATFPPVLADPGRGQLRRLSLELTSAQILALFTTPVTVIPAPGVGYQIVPMFAMLHVFGGVAYTNAGGAVSLLIGPTYAQALAESLTVTAAPNRKTAQIAFDGTEAFSSAGNPPDTDNAPMTISKATGNYAAGTGTARLTIWYVIEPTT